jgi:hypothetical protein
MDFFGQSSKSSHAYGWRWIVVTLISLEEPIVHFASFWRTMIFALTRLISRETGHGDEAIA